MKHRKTKDQQILYNLGMFIQIVATLGLLGAISAAASAASDCDQRSGDALYKCLPSMTSSKPYHEEVELHVQFDQIPLVDMHDFAILNGIEIETKRGQELTNSIFSESIYISLPQGKKIGVSRAVVQTFTDHRYPLPAKEQTVWDYPVGMTIRHVIRWRQDPDQSVFEVRVLQKLPSQRWAFGVYSPKSDGRLYLRTTASKETLLVKNFHQPSSSPIQFRYKPINPNSCRTCHSRHGIATYQYGQHVNLKQRKQFIGPCGFTPELPKSVLEQWEASFISRYGKSPFQSLQPR